MGEKRNAYKLVVRKTKGRRPLGLGGPRCRWVDNIKIDHGEMVWGGMDWIVQAQDRDKWRALVNVVMLDIS
jgi:hypothetical protein